MSLGASFFAFLLLFFAWPIWPQPQWQPPHDESHELVQSACGSSLPTTWKASAGQLFSTCKNSCGKPSSECTNTVKNWCLSRACQKFTGCLENPEWGCKKVEVTKDTDPSGGSGANVLSARPQINDGAGKDSTVAGKTPSGASDGARTRGGRAGSDRTASSGGSTGGTRKSGNNETIKTPGASGDAGQDSQTCAQLQRRANQCCNNPESCGGSSSGNNSGALQSAISRARSEGRSDQDGIREYCSQAQSTGALGSAYNASMGNVCYEAYSACQASCEDMARTYGGSQASDFRSRAQQCAGLSQKSAMIGQQGLSMAGSGMDGDICSQMSQAQGQSTPGGGMGGGPGGNGMGGENASPFDNPMNNAMNPNDPFNCQFDPSHPACAKQNAGDGQGIKNEFSELEKNPGEQKFNLADGADSFSQDSLSGGETPSAGRPSQNATIPNNSGGSIPGAGASGSASLDSPSKSAGQSKGVNTDIEQGFRSGGGGGSSGSGGGSGSAYNMASGFDDGFRKPAGEKPEGHGLDLKQFLPGGLRDPGRQAGGRTAYGLQINGAHVNLFDRISSRMKERCRLGLLFSCDR